MKKQENGITLVALIITIIILLILAVVSIMAVTGTGLFAKTSDAVSKYDNSQEKENFVMSEHIAAIESYGSGSGKIYYLKWGQIEEYLSITVTSDKISLKIEKYLENGVDYTSDIELGELVADLNPGTTNRNITVVTETGNVTVPIDASYKSFTLPEATDSCYINDSRLYVFIDDDGGFYQEFVAK